MTRFMADLEEMTRVLALKEEPWTRFKCDICNKTFATKKAKENHDQDKHPEEFTCTLCSKGFATKQGKEHHIQDKHQPNYSCLVCKIGKLTISKLQSHNRNIHPN